MIDIIRKHGGSIGWITLTAFVLFGLTRCDGDVTNPQGTGDAYTGPEGMFLFDEMGDLYRFSQGHKTRLTFTGADEGRWSPSGSLIAFDGYLGDIYVMNPDASNRRQLTINPAADEEPTWSPDGTQIVFNSDRDGNNEIYVMNSSDGSNQIRLTNNPASDKHPVWSPDGTTIAFDSNRDGNREIYVMNAADGTNLRNLTNSLTVDSNPDWSPDGTQIVFVRYDDIFVMNADGTNPVNLTNSSDFEDSNPVWSPDGTQIVWEKRGDCCSIIWYMNADGTGAGDLIHGDLQNDVSDPHWKE